MPLGSGLCLLLTDTPLRRPHISHGRVIEFQSLLLKTFMGTFPLLTTSGLIITSLRGGERLVGGNK